MVVEQLFIGSVFLAGVLSFFSPCTLPMLPVYIARLGGVAPGGQMKTLQWGKLRVHPVLLANTLVFVLGLSFVFVLLGFGAGALGSMINSQAFIIVCGIIVILFGIHQTDVVQFLFLHREKKITFNVNNRKGLIASFLLGLTFSFGWTPCIGPVLAAVLSLSASEGSALQGGIYMIVYTLGLAIPFLLFAIFSDLLLGKLKMIRKHMRVLKISSGLLLIIMGLLLMTNQLHVIAVSF